MFVLKSKEKYGSDAISDTVHPIPTQQEEKAIHKIVPSNSTKNSVNKTHLSDVEKHCHCKTLKI